MAPMFLQSSGGGGGLGSLIFIGAIGGSIWLFVKNRSAYQVDVNTVWPPEPVLQNVVQAYTMDGWQVTSYMGNSATFAKRKGPNVLVALVLLCFFIVPGIVYLTLAGRTLTASANVIMTGPGMSLVRLSANMRGFGGESSVQRAAQAFPRAAGAGTVRSSLPPNA